jgi:hypothetical protein
MDPLRYRACVGYADCRQTKGMGEPVENAVLDGAQVASEVCVHQHRQVPLQMRSSWIHLPVS